MSWRPIRSWRGRILLAAAGTAVALTGTACGPGSNQLYRLRMCETGGNYHEASAPGYGGAYGFSIHYWHAMGYASLPQNASPQLQDAVAARLLVNPGARAAFPACSIKLGL